MLKKVFLNKFNLEQYKKYCSPELYLKVKNLSKKLKGRKIIHVNSASQGGGVAEILKRLVPLMKGLGIKAEWFVVSPKDEYFFYITGKIHDTLQGGKGSLSLGEKKLYLEENKKFAQELAKIKADFYIIHDPQPLAVCYFNSKISPAMARLHIDLSNPNPQVANFIFPFLKSFQRVIFSLKDFVPPDLPKANVRIFLPAIDPLAKKNQSIDLEKAKKILIKQGLNPQKPLVVQISRFDKWKDPLGVVKAYYLAKKKIPNLQLALVGFFRAKDDIVDEKIYLKLKKYAKGDPDIFLFAHLEKIGNLSNEIFVNAMQIGADIILQKSIKEGFGLTVSEGMWKNKPVIGGDVGGIRLQIQDKKNGFLVNSPQEAAQRIIELIKNPSLAKRIGIKAHQRVKERFLITRLLRDYLKVLGNLN